MDHIPDRVLNSKEASELLGVSVRTLDRICQTDSGLKKIQLSPGRVGYPQRELLAWVASRATKSAT